MASDWELVVGWSCFVVQTFAGLALLFRVHGTAAATKAVEAATKSAKRILEPIGLATIEIEVEAVEHVVLERGRRGAVLLHLMKDFSVAEASEHVSALDLSKDMQVAAMINFRRELKNPKVFLSHVRREANFIRSNLDRELEFPPSYSLERATHVFSWKLLYGIMMNQKLHAALVDSIGASLLASGLTALAWLGRLSGERWSMVVDVAEARFSSLLATFRFFPSFLVLGLLTFAVSRWRQWLVNCHTVQARLHDIGTSVGSAVINPDDAQTRRLLFRLYRYLNLVHALTYQNVHPSMPKNIRGFVDIGLLTSAEAECLQPNLNKMRDALIAWTGGTIEEMIREGRLRELAIGNMMICGLRGITARHHDSPCLSIIQLPNLSARAPDVRPQLFVRNMPNVWFAVAKMFVNYLVYFQLAQLALDIKEFRPGAGGSDPEGYHLASLAALTVFTFLCSLLMSSSYWMAWRMVGILSNPFKAGADSYNSDALLGSTDRQLFATLRSQFDVAKRTEAQPEREPVSESESESATGGEMNTLS